MTWISRILIHLLKKETQSIILKLLHQHAIYEFNYENIIVSKFNWVYTKRINYIKKLLSRYYHEMLLMKFKIRITYFEIRYDFVKSMKHLHFEKQKQHKILKATTRFCVWCTLVRLLSASAEYCATLDASMHYMHGALNGQKHHNSL